MVYSKAKLKSDDNKASCFQTILNTKYITQIVTCGPYWRLQLNMLISLISFMGISNSKHAFRIIFNDTIILEDYMQNIISNFSFNPMAYWLNVFAQNIYSKFKKKFFNVSDPALQDICMWRPAQIPVTMTPNILFLLLLVHYPLQVKSKAIFLSSLSYVFLLPSFLFHPSLSHLYVNPYSSPHILAMMCWVLPEHKRNRILWTCRCFSYFVKKNKQISHMRYFISYFGSYICRYLWRPLYTHILYVIKKLYANR
jgi:hypothetical protein